MSKLNFTGPGIQHLAALHDQYVGTHGGFLGEMSAAAATSRITAPACTG